MVGPALFAAVLLMLTVIQYDFMLGIGWEPIEDPAGAWPSGLALGPHGWVQTASFVVSGLLLTVFAAGLHLGATGGRGSRAGPALLSLAGVAMALMGFETDSIRRTGLRVPIFRQLGAFQEAHLAATLGEDARPLQAADAGIRSPE